MRGVRKFWHVGINVTDMDASIDFYATTRNLYRQSRNAKINEGKPGATDDLPNL